MLQVHNVGGSYGANAYLIAAKRPILVDAGIHSLEEITPLEYIVLTHCHYDHIANATQLAEQTGARIAIHEKDADDGVCAIKLHGGEILDLGDAKLEVIHTPGHTPGSICLYGSKQLFSGDTVFPNGGFGRTDLGGNHHELVRSIRLLTTLDVKIMYPGHGDVARKNVNSQIRDSLRLAAMEG